MVKLSLNWLALRMALRMSCVILASILLLDQSIASELPDIVKHSPDYNSSDYSDDTDAMSQVTSVSQLADVQPTDWAFQALQSLVERYGCIAGYPDGTYRGNRAMTRYEFAAGLNACMDRVNELIAAGTANLVNREDLATLQKLQDEFAAELATLRGRVDALEARTSELESNQFSTTTRLNAEVITYLGDAFGANADPINNTTLAYRVRLAFDTSFTGKDRLRTRFQSTNLRIFNPGATPIDNVSSFGGTVRTDFATTNSFSDETRFLPTSQSQNGDFRLNTLTYRFPVNDRLRLHLAANITDPTLMGADPISPFSDYATGALSNFANSNPIYYPLGNKAGAGADLKLTDSLVLAIGYLGQDTGNFPPGEPNVPTPGSGIFNGGYSAFTQLTLYADRLTLGLTYLNSYTPQFGIDTLAGSNAAKVITIDPLTGETNRTVGNHYGVEVNYKISKGFQLGGWLGYSVARVLPVTTAGRATGIAGDATVFNFAVTLAFPDLGQKGNLGGLIVGMQPRLTGTSNSGLAAAIGLPNSQRSDRDTGLHIEGFWRIQLNDNISITPGFLWLTAPNHDERNPDVVVGIVRTSFVF